MLTHAVSVAAFPSTWPFSSHMYACGSLCGCSLGSVLWHSSFISNTCTFADAEILLIACICGVCAAEKLELVYKEAPTISQVWVYGNSYESTLVAVVIPDSHEIKGWARENGLGSDLVEIVKSEKVSCC